MLGWNRTEWDRYDSDFDEDEEDTLEEEKKVIREAMREKDAETALGDAIRYVTPTDTTTPNILALIMKLIDTSYHYITVSELISLGWKWIIRCFKRLINRCRRWGSPWEHQIK